MNSTLLDELFIPYCEAMESYNTCCDAYRIAQRAASDILRKIEGRQRTEHSEIISQIADLESEEKRIKIEIRQRVQRGENSPDADLGAGARLAVIYERKAALQAVSYTHLDVYKRQPLYLPVRDLSGGKQQQAASPPKS